MTDDAWIEYIKDIKKKVKHAKIPKVIKSNHSSLPTNIPTIAQKTLLKNLKIPTLPPTISQKRIPEFKVDITIDLHGLNQAQAFLALKQCLEKAYANSKKHVLIVTGKGPLDKPGVIKLVVPRWLQYTELSKYILSYSTAKYYLGGEGAIIVTLNKGAGL